MTTLHLSDTNQDPATPLLARVKWSIVVPWLVTAWLGGSDLYHRFLVGETARQDDSREIVQLRREVANLNEKVAVLIAIVDRIEDRQRAEARTRR